MTKIAPYSGSRNPRFVTIRRSGTLDDAQHSLLAAWTADCAEHVLEYFRSQRPDDGQEIIVYGYKFRPVMK